ncbi:uncharacterized protein K489DRAFT_91298 [Dissoconium aciculare CBS 342.82]|uniref:Uncharacterized protein n=1 Tax=Dissoconium aciculare CBS 342.82 TaxID=1314786 RepID=A0A6J3LV99_9PEZI|nr:uncharacterized protein K489DRAFT_91298 [Dissoconium aciculare CBS 342.82]KAF1818552.1 hypothetical protein K489DRAFT_91298 [Dissoconium aciculare CBS 342.82]
MNYGTGNPFPLTFIILRKRTLCALSPSSLLSLFLSPSYIAPSHAFKAVVLWLSLSLKRGMPFEYNAFTGHPSLKISLCFSSFSLHLPVLHGYDFTIQ